MRDMNLLDPVRKTQLREHERARFVFRISLYVLCAVFLDIAGLFFIRLTLKEHELTVRHELSQTTVVAPGGRMLAVSDVVKQLNARVAVLGTALDTSSPEQLLIDLAKDLPLGISITSIAVSYKTKQMNITAVARTRNDIPLFQSHLEAITVLQQPAIQSNINERTDIPLSIHATIANVQQP